MIEATSAWIFVCSVISTAMDLARTLIRSVVRAFYETRHILVVDALFIHSVYDPSRLFTTN